MRFIKVSRPVDLPDSDETAILIVDTEPGGGANPVVIAEMPAAGPYSQMVVDALNDSVA